jgi:hypothetical protein
MCSDVEKELRDQLRASFDEDIAELRARMTAEIETEHQRTAG